jgi:DNA-binding protein Fis
MAAYMPQPIVKAVLTWTEANPERTASMFLRDAVREKLRRDGILLKESK